MKSVPRIRRVAALAVGVVLGLTGLATVGSPASATRGHQPSCVTPEQAKYQHTFDGPKGTASIKLLNGPLCAEQAFALVSYTAPSATFATPQHVLDSSVKKFVPATAGQLSVNKLEFKVEVPECFTQVDFVFGADIINPLTDGSDRYNSRKVGESSAPGNRSTPKPGQPQHAWYNGGSGTCKAEPAVEPLPDCTGNVALKLINRSTHSETFTITADGGFSKTETLKARQEPATVTVPAANAKNIVVSSRGKELYRGAWSTPEDCQVPEVGTPEATVAQTCEGLSFTVKNPENGKEFTVTFTPSTGQPQTITVKPGQTAPPVMFPGSEGLTVKVDGDLDALKGEVAWTKPADCGVTTPPTGTPSPSPTTPVPTGTPETPASPGPSTTPVAFTPGDGEPELPLTGAAVGSITAGAIVLLAAGAGLFLMARRRKLKFQA
ncbi:LPXTG cell wall anchor domain-containing protein [Catenuloplanes atrovinosus]|uniref:LPXTG-motif cell wall-anchored protein n=1 Tax=Catenuloplanes atrovinosus TaxID=137266 RepID=A0AAE4CE05_9ACTN|nr:LPXTG cell wall anchor domain-containing protein [Catenuloplanes atrovinosus]MDR7279584.1 LPXTG-motif cell wall-anchored protein [Catenuloplanes atrovinosus]